MSTTFGQKLRLNVVALISETTVGRLLVCVDEEALVEDLGAKVRSALARSAVEGRLLRLTNRSGANLPSDEKVGDVLRDAEEVVAVLTAEPEDPAVRHQLAGGVGEIMSFARHSPRSQEGAGAGTEPRAFVQQPIAANVYGTGPRLQQRPQGGARQEPAPFPFSGVEESFCTALPPSRGPSPRGESHSARQNTQSQMAQAQNVLCLPDTPVLQPQVPGPAEIFEEDLIDKPAAKALATNPQRGLPSGSDWTVEGLAPKLREYISTRFREANASSAEAGNSFIAVTMRPRSRAGAVPSQSIHYSIARIDVMEFERLCAQKIQEMRSRADHFRRCQQALQSLLSRGASGSEYASNLLPYSYRSGEEFSDLLSETDLPTFGQVEGFRPTIVIDNSGAVGETLVFIRSAMKRMLYSFLVAKSKFNLLKFSPQGNPVAWANGMVPPTAQVLREAEEFLESVKPIRQKHSANLLEGVQMALAHPEADVVYVLTSGLPKRCSLEAAIRSVRSMNVRDLPLHIVGIECDPKAELDLRRLAEDNHGSFRHKRFGPAQGSFGASGNMEITASLGSHDTDDARLTISGQLSILEIMLDEQERHTVDWLEEQKCANRLLLTTASQQAVSDVDQSRGLYQRAAIRDIRKQMDDSQSRLQELVDVHIARVPSPYSPAAAATYLGGPGAERKRVAAKAEQRAASLPRAVGAGESIRRPSVVNPWDRPGAVIKTSQLTGKNSRGAGPPRHRSARSRPSSARGARF